MNDRDFRHTAMNETRSAGYQPALSQALWRLIAAATGVHNNKGGTAA